MRKSLCVGLAAVLLAVAPALATATGGSAWGPAHILYSGSVKPTLAQATSNEGMTVTAFRTLPGGSQPQVKASVQLAGKPWSTPLDLYPGSSTPTVLAWGAGNVSVVWQSHAGRNAWQFHLRTVGPDGRWGDAQTLVTATSAYPWYQAAMNDKGELALAWVNADNTDRVAIHHADGVWAFTPAVPVVHPTSGGTPFIANPLKLFLTESGQATDVTWGTLGSSGRAIWKMRFGGDGAWHPQRIGPINGETLGYDWVGEANFAADPSGDVAAVWPQQNPTTRQWTTAFRYWPSDGPPSAVKELSHLRCDYLSHSCADVAMTTDGAALMAYAVNAGGGDVTVRFLRRSAGGTFTSPQAISQPIWGAPYMGVRLSSNAQGDGLVSFIGGNRQKLYSEFARCPASGACDQALARDSSPSWLEAWVSTVGPYGGSTVTWVGYLKKHVTARHLAVYRPG